MSRNQHATHRLHDSGETYDYICWAGTIETLEQAKTVAALWANCTSEMLQTGEAFDTICARRKQNPIRYYEEET